MFRNKNQLHGKLSSEDIIFIGVRVERQCQPKWRTDMTNRTKQPIHSIYIARWNGMAYAYFLYTTSYEFHCLALNESFGRFAVLFVHDEECFFLLSLLFRMEWNGNHGAVAFETIDTMLIMWGLFIAIMFSLWWCVFFLCPFVYFII